MRLVTKVIHREVLFPARHVLKHFLRLGLGALSEGNYLLGRRSTSPAFRARGHQAACRLAWTKDQS